MSQLISVSQSFCIPSIARFKLVLEIYFHSNSQIAGYWQQTSATVSQSAFNASNIGHLWVMRRSGLRPEPDYSTGTGTRTRILVLVIWNGVYEIWFLLTETGITFLQWYYTIQRLKIIYNKKGALHLGAVHIFLRGVQTPPPPPYLVMQYIDKWNVKIGFKKNIYIL